MTRNREGVSRLVEAVRLPKNEKEAEISGEEKELISDTARQGRDILKRHFMPELGVIPSENPEENFYNQLWARDAAHFVGNVPEDFVAAWTSLANIFKHQKENGMLPFRVEKEYMMVIFLNGKISSELLKIQIGYIFVNTSSTGIMIFFMKNVMRLRGKFTCLI